MGSPANVAVLSLACRFPDARSAEELWTNVVEGRRSFRPIPATRIDIARYQPGLAVDSEAITPVRAGLLTNWSPDRDRFRIPQRTLMATDPAHWLALELAADAIEAVGGVGRLNRARTAVIVANTLTGEFSRAWLLRLRLPFLEDVLDTVAHDEKLPADVAAQVRSSFAAELRRRLPDPNEDSLAGALANTIAGRIANYYDLGGGAYSIDGACASSLLALANASSLLSSGEVDAAIVVAVDLSLDPFELVGFSRAGALASGSMRVFDAHASGFWPGEGGACVLLVREDDALTDGLPVIARVRGWGISTDGAGSLTRPSTDGQITALRRAYEMAATEPDDVAFVEAHGTGTAVGDPIEVRALAALRDKARRPLPIGSIKANIGHTKAAAGLAGFVKVVQGLRHGLVPPHVSCSTPHPVFAEVGEVIRVAFAGEGLDEDRPALAGVSSFGFGGINAHLVVERAGTAARRSGRPISPIEQDCELFLFSGETPASVAQRIGELELRAGRLSDSELVDAAAYAAAERESGPVRAAVVASHAGQLAQRLARAKIAVLTGETVSDLDAGVFVGRFSRSARIGFLFPGQGAPSRPSGGVWRRRFTAAADLISGLPEKPKADALSTEIAQPAVIAASLAAWHVVEDLGITASVAVGHSLGEIAALAWAGALSRGAAFDLARTRGAVFACDAVRGGAMLRVELPPDETQRIALESGTVVACWNATAEAVLSGSREAIAMARAFCQDRGIESSILPVSHAFHSPHMAMAAEQLVEVLRSIQFSALRHIAVSTVTGRPVAPDTDIRQLLVRQITAPVQFSAALSEVAARADYLLEIGPGQGLSRLARDCGLPAISVDAFSPSLEPLLLSLAALFTKGVDIRAQRLFDGRAVRAFDPAALPSFIENPCGGTIAQADRNAEGSPTPVRRPQVQSDLEGRDPLSVVLSAIENETGLCRAQIGADDRFLDSLHLNSLAVSRIVVAAATSLNVHLPATPTEFANATPRLLAEALAELHEFGAEMREYKQRIDGVRPWVRTYAMTWTAASERVPDAARRRWSKVALDDESDAVSGVGRGAAMMIWIPDRFGAALAERLIAIVAEAARASVVHLALCHDGAAVAAFARSVADEGCFQSVRVIDRAGADDGDRRIDGALGAEAIGYYEVRLARGGGIEQPIFLPMEPRTCSTEPLARSDVAVVTGGGKGIAAECALRIADQVGAVILVGRSSMADPEVVRTLDRLRGKPARCRYVQADVLDADALVSALTPALGDFGPATVLVHAPAVNEPARIVELDAATVRRTLAPKTQGLEIALAALGPGLRQVITFGSLIGRLGLGGEAHYALANALQTAATEAWATAAEGRSGLAIEWTLWGGAGMGERLGTVERLSARGVDAISVDDAVSVFDQLLASNAVGAVAVTGRFGPPADLLLGPAELPTMRFLDEPRVHFPGVELVVETTLSRGRDPYLDDHLVAERPVLPAVMGLEAMAQAAAALKPLGPRVAVRAVAFTRAITPPVGGALRIRIAALRAGHMTDVALLAEDDDFQSPCMTATFEALSAAAPTDDLPPDLSQAWSATPLYGPLFFGGRRFQKLESIGRVTSREVNARVAAGDGAKWFGSFEPEVRALWDPGVADAVLHALQAAVPHRRVVPIAVDRIEIDSTGGRPVSLAALERHSAASTYAFDISLTDKQGRVVQRWRNAVFRAIESICAETVLSAAPSLTSAYLERAAREELDDGIRVAVVQGDDRISRRAAAIASLGLAGKVERRVDGRPVRIDGGGSISVAHADGTTVAIAGGTAVSCDIEPIPDADGDRELLCRHIGLEVCRKLGRPALAVSAKAAIPGAAMTAGDIRLVAFELPIGPRRYLVAFGQVHERASWDGQLGVLAGAMP